MSVAAGTSTGESPVASAFADEYDKAFVAFVRHVVGQGVPVNERVMESAHERASKSAVDGCAVRGFRSADFAPLKRAGLARMRARYGY